MYLFSGEELKAKAPPAEPCIFRWRDTGTQLKQQVTESTREGKNSTSVYGKKSERLLSMK